MAEVVGYSILVIALALLCFPITPLALTSIPLLGPVMGPFIVAHSVTVAALLAFGLGRRLQGSLVRMLKRLRFSEKNIATVEEAFMNDRIWPFLILRNLPHPFMPVSYAAGSVAGADFGRFASITFVTLLLRGGMLAVLGEAVLSDQPTLVKFAIGIVLLLLFALMVKHVRQAASRKLEPGSAPGPHPGSI